MAEQMEARKRGVAEPFAPVGAEAAPAGYWSIGVVVLLLVFAVLMAGVGAGIAMMVVTAGAAQPAATMDPALLPPVITTAIAALFVAFALGAVFWTRVVERRSLASIGFSGAAKLARYARGVAGGVLLAVALMGLSGVFAALLGVEGVTEDWDVTGDDLARLGEPAFVRMYLIIIVLFLIQGASEEVVFRGWMLSSLALKAGLVAALIGSSLMFGLVHADRLLISIPAGLGVLAGTAMVGLAFARWALAERGIFGVCGAHGGYNLTLILASLTALILTSEAQTPADLIGALFEEMETALASDSALPLIMAQLMVFGALAALLWRAGSRAQANN